MIDPVPLETKRMVWMSNGMYEAHRQLGYKNPIIKISSKTFNDANFPTFQGRFGPFPSFQVDIYGSGYLFMCDYSCHAMQLDDSIPYGKAVIQDRP